MMARSDLPYCLPVSAATQQSRQAADLTAAEALLSLAPPAQSVPAPPTLIRRVSSPVPPPMMIATTGAPLSQFLAATSLPPRSASLGVVSVDGSADSSSDSESVASSSFHQPLHFNPNVSLRSSLALETDEDYLSALHVFERKYCVEAFTATPEDVARHCAAELSPGQVGIRCLHCAHRPARERAERAVCFPSSLKNIYHAIETWQRRHALVCTDLPVWVKRQLTDLTLQSKTGSGGRRKYWEESAKQIGLVDTPTSGIRFARQPCAPTVSPAPASDASCCSDTSDLSGDSNHSSSSSSLAVPALPVVQESDQPLVTPYLYTLLDQMETCQFAEEDRQGGRSKAKLGMAVGFAGFQCKHCAGRAGCGRYFPTSVGALSSANSDRNMLNHLSKCRRCPQSVKDQLVALKSSVNNNKKKTTTPAATAAAAGGGGKNKRGSRKLFFQRVWNRIHADDDAAN